MKPKNMSKEELEEKIRLLLQIVADDLRNLKEPNRAGWRKLSDLENLGITEKQLGELLDLGILDKNLINEIRIRYKDKKIREKLSSFDIQFQQIDYFIENQEMLRQDFERVQRAENIIQQIVSTLQNNEESLAHGIAIGIWRMLSASDMPAVIDDILSAGFSPKDWGIISLRSIPYLSIEFTKKVGNIERLEDAFNHMKSFGFINEIPNLSKINADEASKVKEVLKWQEIWETLSETNIKFLGISWFAVFILEENDALPSYIDFSTKVVNLIKRSVESILKTEYSDLANNLTHSITALDEQHISWASGIIFLPEVL